ncbi:MAG: sugar phosphate nucleotidyltransferase [Myxococcota bacterium]
MILAAGLGTRMRPLTDERAKPALPVRGRPVISLLLELLARQGIREVLINLHHLPDTIRRAVESDHPAGLEILWSDEERPLGTGGGIRRAAEFLRQSETCVVLAGDMLLDLDLRALAARHVASGRDVSLVLRSDPRESTFGSIGVDAGGRVCRIGRHPVAGAAPEAARGLFTSVRFFQRTVLRDWPANEIFEDLRDWLMPRAAGHAIVLGAEIVDASDSVWEPVGTPQEYLDVNLNPPDLPRLGGAAARWQGAVELSGRGQDVVSPRTLRLPDDADLARCVVWDGASVRAGTRAREGVFGLQGFHRLAAPGTGDSAAAERRGAA